MTATGKRRFRRPCRRPALVSVAVALLVAAGSSVAAQTGSIEVRVLDAAADEPLAGATVTLTSDRGLIVETVLLTDGAGRCDFPVLRAGEGYTLEIALPGYARQRLPGVRVPSSEIERVVVRLWPAQQERVQVVARDDVVDLEATGSTTRFTDEFLESLPIPGRFYQNVLSLAPGVNDVDGDGNPNVHGARSRDFQASVGGVNNADPLSGEWLSFVHPESISELEVIAAGAGVEFGRAQGGFARILQKQGSNEFEGVVSLLYRTSALDGNGTAADSPRTGSPAFHWSQPSVQVSGPIVRDRLWYRVSHERIDGDEPRNLIGVVDVSNRTQRIASDQITWQATPRNKFQLQYQSFALKLGKQGLGSTVPAETTRTFDLDTSTWSITWVAPYSTHLLMESLIAYQDGGQSWVPTTTAARQNCMRFFIFGTLNQARCFNEDSGRSSGSFPEISSDARQRFTLRSEGTWYRSRWLGASHRVKFGFVVEDERYARDLDRGPDLDFHVERIFVIPCPFNPGGGCFQDVGFGTARIHVPRVTAGTARGKSWGLWIEDQFKPSPGFAVTLGMRVDHEEIDSLGLDPFDPQAEARRFEALVQGGVGSGTAAARTFTSFDGIAQFQDDLAEALGVDPAAVPLGPTARQSAFWTQPQRPVDIALSSTNLSPRLALAWDPGGAGKTKLAMSVGRYYDKVFLAVPLVELEPVSTTMLWRGSRFLSARFNTGFPDTAVNPAVTAQLVDRNLRTPYQDELSVSFERALWAESSLRLSYIRRRFRDQLQDVDLNHRSGDRGRCVVAEDLRDPTVVASAGSGQNLVDPYTDEEYIDTDPGRGDGRIDDCTGRLVTLLINNFVFPPLTVSVARPDGLDDLYVQNPGWGEILLVGNFNSADYEAAVLELTRRQYRGWQMQASYTWSEAIGDAEDFLQTLGNERNLRDDERGRLSYDQRHVVRVQAATATRGGLRLGGTLRWEAGLPYSELQSLLTVFAVPPEYGNFGDVDAKLRRRYPSRQRNDRSNAAFWTLDLRLAREFALGRRAQLQLTAELFNVLGDDTLTVETEIDSVAAAERRFGRRYQLGARLAF